MNTDLAIIGAGAAGLFAACCAADRGLRCVVIERKARPAAKLLMTANGRCNFTRDIPLEQFLRDLGEPTASFVHPALTALPPKKIIAGFERLGIAIDRRNDGRIFPASGQAATIVHALGDRLRDKSVPIIYNAPVTNIGLQGATAPCQGAGQHPAFLLTSPSFTFTARNVLVATGGASFPKTGSVGDGQEWARQLGLKVEPLRAGLVGYDVGTVRGVPINRYEDGVARVIVGGREVFATRGEVDIERWGVSGSAMYNASRYVARNVHGAWTLQIDCAGKHFEFASPRPRPLKEAIVTLGGVALDEIDSTTMQTRRVKGLYFAGEVLNIDGPTGGYNLTLAFATARAAIVAMCNDNPRH